MALNVEDFYSAFAEREVREIKLKTLPDSFAKEPVIYLKALSSADVQKMRALNNATMAKRGMSALTGSKLSEEDYQDNLTAIENYLLLKTVCDISGKMFFDKIEDVEKFNEAVKPECVNEIMFHIQNMNELYGGFKGKDKILEELKKKFK